MESRTRYCRTLLLLCAVLYPVLARAQSLKVQLNGDQLHLSSPNLRLLSTDARQQLRNGATVTYAFRVNVRSNRTGDIRNSFSYHCVFSYDLWEEKYKVVRREPGYRSASHLSQTAVEQLCLESLVVPVSSLPADMPFWVTVDYQMEDRRTSDDKGDPRSIPGMLVDIFSRRTTEPETVDKLEGGPFRLSDFRKSK
jgi:hypothetical protein